MVSSANISDKSHASALAPTFRGAATLPQLALDKVAQDFNALRNLLLVHAGKAQAQGVGSDGLEVEEAPGGKEHPALAGLEEQSGGVEAGRQRHPDGHAAVGPHPGDFLGEVRRQSSFQEEVT